MYIVFPVFFDAACSTDDEELCTKLYCLLLEVFQSAFDHMVMMLFGFLLNAALMEVSTMITPS